MEFRSAASILAVCGYCQSTLLRRDIELENIGKMAALAEDASPIQLGTEGKYKDVHFAVIGRIQLRYEQGIWNEWFLLFDNQRTGWLGEGSGEYYVTFLAPVPEAVPAFQELSPGKQLTLQKTVFTVSDLETARCVAGEGELPFQVGAGYDVQTADLRVGTTFASIDYSETPPLVFLGEPVRLPDLSLANLRQADAPGMGKTIQAKTFHCTACGAPLAVHVPLTKAVACASCGSLLNAENEEFSVLARLNLNFPYEPPLSIGAKGKLRGVDYEIIGWMRREVRVDNLPYQWTEYLLLNPLEGFRWLTEYNGHWNLVKPASSLPKMAGSSASYLGRRFDHFQGAKAKVVHVMGEFYWQVRVGETCYVADFVAPPLMLSREETGKEITWSLGEYVEPGVIQQAFKPERPMPLRVGVGANQPSPYDGRVGRMWAIYGGLAVLAFVVQMGFVFLSSDIQSFQQRVELEPKPVIQTVNSQPFHLAGHPANVVIRNHANVGNSWLDLSMTLVNRTTGVSYPVNREISYYYGVEGGESWSEGSPNDEALLTDVPEGDYILEIETEGPPDRNDPVALDVEVYRGVPRWSNFWLAVLALLLPPVLVTWRSRAYETRRWDDSDHPRSEES